MGCASSTPMVATAGSEMLKAATHVAGDVQKQGEAAVEGASETLNATLDTAKETVSSAVAGVTNELGNAFKDGTQALDEAKHKVLEGLHLETDKQTEDAAPSISRAPTPSLEADADSLKTSTPEPEIERALANSAGNEEEAPPTPKPSLQELAELSTQVVETQAAEAATTAAAAAAVGTAAAATTAVAATGEASTQAIAATVDARLQRVVDQEKPQPRPGTTEWEMLADQLAKDRKFKPYESFVHSQNQFSVYQDYTSLRDKPGHYDGHFSGHNSQSSASQSQSDLSSGHLTPAPPHRHGQRDYAKFVAAEQPASVSRASSRLSNMGVPSVRNFDFNPQRERISLPITSNVGSRVGSRVDSAVNGRRSLWARNKPEMLPEEPYAQLPLRRSSMTPGLSLASTYATRNAPAYRSTSNLATSPLTSAKQRANFKLTTPLQMSPKPYRRSSLAAGTAQHPRYNSTTNLVAAPLPQHMQRDHLRLNTTNSSQQQMPGNRWTMESTFRAFEPISPEELMTARPLKSARESRQDKTSIETAESLQSFNLATRINAKLHSPAKVKSQLTPANTPPSVIPLATTFIAESTEAARTSGSAVRQVTPTSNPHTPRRLNTGQTPVAIRASTNNVWQRAAQEDADATTPKTSTTTTPKKWSTSVNHTPSRLQTQTTQSFTTKNAYLHSPAFTPSRSQSKCEQSSAVTKTKSPTSSRASSRLSSHSSTEIVIKPLSHLNTPSAVSLLSDDVVITEYSTDELANALARLSDCRGSTTTLHSVLSNSSLRVPTHSTSARMESRRTSPWLRSQAEHTNSQQHRTYSSCGVAELGSTTKSTHPQFERCDICCNEFVMK